jgi:thiosulfate/3-mercaptopyruvate sulfurtransferase
MHPRLFILATSLAFATAGAQAPAHSMLVSTDWLARRLNDPSVVVLQVIHDDAEYRGGHIPGARAISYMDVTIEHDGISTELPPVEQLVKTFEKLGISDNSHVVVYVGGAGMAPMASRVFLTLDYLGHEKVSLLNGGLAKWRAEGRAVSVEDPRVAPGRLTPQPQRVTVDANWVNSRAGKPGYAFIDTRTDPEYLGTGSRGGLPSQGHIAGARQLEWQQLFASADSAVFLEPNALAKLFADRMAPGDTVVTYCLVGYRASMTYFGARLLGLPVRLYDGSYQDWARRSLPVKKGETP